MKASPQAQIGVLFVHGIGRQTPGQTLIEFGEPLIGWLRRWIAGSRDGELRILKSALGEPVLSAGEPAHLAFQCSGSDGETVVERRWLLAESCWAAEFRNPPFGRLAAWMLGVGAWMVLSHFGKLIRLRLAGWKRWVLGWPVLLLGVVLALVVQLLVALLAVVAVLPIPRLRRALSGLLLALTGTLGDSYVLVSSPVQEAAAVSRLRRDLGWLSARAQQVFVIAHSQGAAIAHQALQRSRPPNISRLFTFGSGIGKLEELRLLAQPANRHFYLAVQFGLPLAMLSVLLLPRTISALSGSFLLLGVDLYFLLFVLAPVLILGRILAITWSGWLDYLEHVRTSLPLPGLAWHDFYATADPVPNGPLVDGLEGLPGLECHEVVNLGSAVADHSAYWANQDEFVAAIVREIDAAAGSGLSLPDETLAKAAGARRKRVRLLAALRAATAAGAALALFGLRDQLRSLAEGLVWEPLALWRKTGLLGALAESLAAGLGAVARLVTGAPAETLRAWGLVALGGLILCSAIALCHLLAVRVWKWWDRFAIDDFFMRRRWLWSTSVAAALAMLLSATPLIFGGAALATGDLGASLAIVAVAFQWYLKALALMVLLVAALIAAYVLLMSLHSLAENWKKVVVGAAAVLVGIPAATFLVAALATRDLQRSVDLVVATNLRLAAVVAFPLGIVLAILLVWAVWAKWSG